MRALDCAAHRHDHLVPVESHHVHPLGYHGPDTAANRTQVCANAHSDAHYLLARLLKTGGHLPWAEERTYGIGVRAIAHRGFAAVMAYAATLTTDPTGTP